MQHSVKSYFFGMFLLLVIGLLTSETVEAIGKYKDVYPERIHTTRHKRDLSTSVKGDHEDKVTYKIGDIVLDLKRSEKIHPGHILVRSYDEETEQLTHEKVTPEQCYYHGKIRGNEDSNVHISTCDGLHGIIDDGKVKRDIEKINDDGLHRLHDELINDVENILRDLDNEGMYPGNGLDNKSNTKRDTNHTRESHYHNDNKHQSRFSLFNVEEQYKKYLGENSKTRYIEMFVCTDERLYEKYGKDKNKVIDRVLNAYTQVDKAYQAINIRIVIVAVEVLVKKTFERFESAGYDLYSFKIYWNEVIKKDSNFKDIRMDNGQFLSHYHWSSVGGMAYGGGMCSYDSVAVNRWYYYIVNGPKVILGHELGHNLNFLDDGPECTCLSTKGCFMGGTKSSMPGFSDCSMKSLQQKDFECLNDYPERSLKSVCGNGIREDNEECDCGTEENCKKKNDHCCEPHGCKLKQGAQCSHFNFPGCCSEKCLFRRQGTLCREAAHLCDLSEYCSGKSEKCPADQVKINGHHCDRHPSMLIGPTKRYGETISYINKVSARYLKFVPKKWNKDGYPGFKLSIHGCPAGELSSGLTAIFTEWLYYLDHRLCLSPKVQTCSDEIPDGTELLYTEDTNNGCRHKHVLFSLQSDGSLVHVCSRKKVCTLDDKEKPVLSSKCEGDNAKFRRTKDLALQQVSSNLCFTSTNGFPNVKSTVALKDQCLDIKYRRQKLHFLTQDCQIDLLSKLEKNAFKASSFRASFEPENVRYDGKGWSANQKTGNNWLKIDFGSIKQIDTIGMKDIYWNWVYGYHLYYSNDNVNFLPYISKTDMEKGTLTCYNGQCIPNLDHQCKSLWDIESQRAPEQCWRKFNIENSHYGTCKATAEKKCEDEEMYCGQIQCSSNLEKPLFIDYANPKNIDRYKNVTVDGKRCSGASIVGNEDAGLGMVNDGTKCGENKICVQQKCVSIETLPNLEKCQQTCKGTCKNDGSCYCQENLNPEDGCNTLLTPIHGMWSSWSEYSPCSLACGKGTQTRFRFCNQPYAQFGGNDCEGDREETHNCNIEDCPIERSCLALRNKLKKLGKPLYDGIYIIEPKKDLKLKVNCDMTRHGGGWTLIVSSESNTWTDENVYERNKDKPYLKSDYSILKYANHLKENYLIKSDKFQYILEANFKDRWGGVWEAPNEYDISSTNKYLSNVKLIKKFDDWEVGKYTIDNRLPYVNKYALTTSRFDKDAKQYGSITDNKMGVHPSFWIYGDLKLTKPEFVWYWVREGEYKTPVSCFEILKRGKTLGKDYPNGFYMISPDSKTPMKTFCDFTRHGGGWTLLIQKSSNNGWTKDNAGSRGNSISEQSLPNDFSIFKYIDYLKGTDPAEITFQYMIEADGDDKNGGIFEYSVLPSLLTYPPRNIKPKLLKRFGNWDGKENFENFPMFRSSANGVFVKAGIADSEDKLGSIISDGSDQNVGYMNSLKNPKNIKVWIREGGSRKSCNDIAVRGYHKGKEDYKNGFYLINNNQFVYCDMEKTKKEGWTLLVTSVSSGWTKDMVLSRNEGNPSISKDYSILSTGNSIKRLSLSKTFKYMLDAGQRHRWGGIFQASTQLSLIGDKKEETTQLEQFDTWSTNWWDRLSNILPYLGRESKGRALLTTAARNEYYYESGTICAKDSNGFHPAMWVDTNRNPGSIWYWLNENDCGSDYKKVDGGFSEWSTWTRCQPCVQNQKRTRKRFCDDPKPSCGGEECKLPLEEETDCEVNCKATLITSKDGEYCLEPETGGCSANDVKIVYRPRSTHCNTDASKFAYDPDKGVITHICSKKRVCVMGELKSGSQAVLSISCPEQTNANAAWRTVFGTIQYGNKCFQPDGGKIENGKALLLSSSYCMQVEEKLSFENLDSQSMPVKMKFYKLKLSENSIEEFMKNEGFPNGEHISGYIDNMITPSNIDWKYQVKLSTFFKAPLTGDYRFVVAVNDMAQLYIGEVPGEEGMKKKKKIVNVGSRTGGRFSFETYPWQKSDAIELKVGNKYYLEALMIEVSMADYLTIGVYFPDGTSVIPITSYYLSRNAD